MAQVTVEIDTREILDEMDSYELRECFKELIDDFDDCFFDVLDEYMKRRRNNMDKFKMEILKKLFKDEDYYSPEELIEKINNFVQINYFN